MEQNTNAWLEWRKNGIGASDTPIILGVSRFSTPFQLWNEKLGLKKQEFDQFITDLGHRFEPIARSEFALETGIDLEPAVVQHKDIEWLCASLDGFSKKEDVFGEIKYVGQEKFDEVKSTGKVLEEHFPQIQHQFLVTGMKRCVYIVYTLNEKRNELKDVHWIWPKRDLGYITDVMFPAIEHFWNLLQTQTAPALCDKDIIEIKGKKKLANKFISIVGKIKALEKLLDETKEEILEVSDHANFLIGKVKISRFPKKGRVNYKKVPQLKDVDLDQYRGQPTIATKMTIQKDKAPKDQ